MGQLDFLFIGGPGRSGTSHVARSLLSHPQVAGFPDVELKLINEISGLADLGHSLTQHYSPNRAIVSVRHFKRLAMAVFEGGYGQPPLNAHLGQDEWRRALDAFSETLCCNGHPTAHTPEEFAKKALRYLENIAELCVTSGGSPTASVFLEKTPHILLAAEFLATLRPGSKCLHVIRDPRAIATSLQRVPWGPTELKTCCTWVRSYFEQYARVRSKTDNSKLNLIEIKIEDVASDPQSASLRIGEWLGIDADPQMFCTTSGSHLRAWRTALTTADKETLSVQLDDLAEPLGYPTDEPALAR